MPTFGVPAGYSVQLFSACVGASFKPESKVEGVGLTVYLDTMFADTGPKEVSSLT